MAVLMTDITVLCRRDNCRVDVKNNCEGPPCCPFFKHFAYRSTTVYIVCGFGEKSQEDILRQPPDPELERMEEESLEENEPR